MIQGGPQFIIGADGRKRGVLLGVTHYRRQFRRIEDLESILTLDRAARSSTKLAALLDTEAPAEAAEAASLEVIGAFGLAGQGPLEEGKHFVLTAGWGHAGPGGITMPGKGKSTERDYAAEERHSMGKAAVAMLGERTLDICLNESAYWSNIPRRVWDYTLGGYQVIKKWLSYREGELLGRPLTLAEYTTCKKWPGGSQRFCCSNRSLIRTTCVSRNTPTLGRVGRSLIVPKALHQTGVGYLLVNSC